MNFKNNQKPILNQVLTARPAPKQGFQEWDASWFEDSLNQTKLPDHLFLRKRKSPKLFIYSTAASILVAVTIGLYLQFSSGFDKDRQKVAVVIQMTGQAYLKGHKDRVLKIGDTIQEGQILQTQPDSHIDLSLPGGVLVRVAPQTQYQLHSIQPDHPGKMDTRLHTGTVYTLVEKLSKEESFSIQTPTAIAGVRGTSFRVTVNQNKTSVHLIQGSVSIRTKGADPQENKTNEYILDQYDKNFIEIEPDQSISHQSRTESDFVDARQLDDLGRNLQNPQIQKLALDKKGIERATNSKKDRKHLYSIIRMNDGTVLRGLIISQSHGNIFVESAEKSIIIKSGDVSEIKFLDSE